jgi:catechol 2,3-dioxygenase-like lactoylglutathione lyase family enzyme
MTIQRMDHVGTVVEDLAEAVAFFIELGLEPALATSHDGRLLSDSRAGQDERKHAGGEEQGYDDGCGVLERRCERVAGKPREEDAADDGDAEQRRRAAVTC